MRLVSVIVRTLLPEPCQVWTVFLMTARISVLHISCYVLSNVGSVVAFALSEMVTPFVYFI